MNIDIGVTVTVEDLKGFQLNDEPYPENCSFRCRSETAHIDRLIIRAILKSIGNLIVGERHITNDIIFETNLSYDDYYELQL
jgi:hypothetical protein